MTWAIKNLKNTEIKKPILIAGLPGIGNVSKIAVDFIITELEAVKIKDISSHYLPHSVFVNDDNLIELPSITIHHKNINNQDYLFLVGDAQPIDEPSTYRLCETILDYLKSTHCKEIVCLAGIGLQNEPNKPKTYCTASKADIIKKYKEAIDIDDNLAGIVGPILGVSGLLPGLAQKHNIPAIILLTETFAHPLYVGIKGAKEIVKLLNTKFELGISLEKLEKDIKELEDSVRKKSEDISKVTKTIKSMKDKDINYIG